MESPGRNKLRGAIKADKLFRQLSEEGKDKKAKADAGVISQMISQFETRPPNLREAQRLIEAQEIQKKDIKLFEYALSHDEGQIRTVRKMILKHPSWINKCLFNHGQWNALHVTAAEEQVPKLCYLLKQEGIDVNAPDKYNFTALELAMVRNSDTTIAKNLLQAGASIDHINFRSLRPQFKELIEAMFASRCMSETLKIVANVVVGKVGHGQNITAVVVPPGVYKIKDRAFSACTRLTSLTLPDTLQSIGDNAFEQCSGLASITLPDKLNSIDDYVFAECSGLTSVTLPDILTSIGYRAFFGCSSLTSLALPNNVKSIGDYAFSQCVSLTSLALPENLNNVGQYAFQNCSGLSSLTIPETLHKIGVSTFAGCSGLTSLTLPDTLTRIGYRAFEQCSGLTSLTLPLALTTFGRGCFYGCKGLTTVTFRPSGTDTSGAFIAWAASSSKLAAVKQSRKMLGLIMEFVVERRAASTVDPDGRKGVFEACPGLNFI